MSLLNPHSEELSKEIFTCTIKKKQKKHTFYQYHSIGFTFSWRAHGVDWRVLYNELQIKYPQLLLRYPNAQ